MKAKLVKESLDEYGLNLSEHRGSPGRPGYRGDPKKSASQLGMLEYTKNDLSDSQIFSLAKAYLSNRLNLPKLDSRIKVARDLGKLTSKNPLNANEGTGELALLFKCVKSGIISMDEYKQLYIDLNELHKWVLKGLRNADPASRYFKKDDATPIY